MKQIVNTNSRKSIKEMISDYTVIDLETTGMSAKVNEIIEVAAVRVRDGVEVDRFASLVKPKKRIPPYITSLTGISNEMVEDASPIEEVLAKYLEFIGDDIALGHNIAAFDRHFLEQACEKVGLPIFCNDVLDTYYFARRCQVRSRDYKLTTLTRYFRIPHNDAHRALGDCIANHLCYERLKKYMVNKLKKEQKL